MNELLRAVAVLAEPPVPAHARIAAALGLPSPQTEEYTDVFLFQLYPYASPYVGAEGMLGGEARDRVAGFWRALGITPPAEPDHLAALLSLYAELSDHDAPEQWRRALLWEHLLSWLPAWLARLDAIAPPAYRKWGRTLRAILSEQALALGPQERLPLHLREAPPFELSDLLQGLLAPVRSGLVLVRDDLRRAAAELGLGLRAGERRYVLRALLEQDTDATLGWLASQARRANITYAEDAAAFGPVSTFWQERAAATAALLQEARTAAASDAAVHA